MFSSAEVALKAEQLLKSPSEVERTQANVYLCAFQESTEAWGICRELIVPSSSEIPMLFACQVLYVKIKADWCKLDNAQRDELRQYIDSLLSLPLLPIATKKICQCYAFIGMFLMTTTWEQFIPYLLESKAFNISLEVMDCIPYCLDEFSMSGRISERIKTLISEQAQIILGYFNDLIVNKGCLWQVLEVMKGWRLIKLNVMSDIALVQTLLTALSDPTSPHFPSVCRVLLDAVNNCSSASLLSGKVKLKPSMTLDDVLKLYPPQEKDSLLALALVLTSVSPNILATLDIEVKQAGTELIVGFSNSNQAFFIWNEPLSVSLWQMLDGVVGSSELEVASSGLDFWYEFKDLLFKVRPKQSVTDSSSRPWLFDHMVRHTGLIALKAQYLSYEDFESSIKPSSEISLANYRASSEDVFNGFFQLFEKYHPQKGLFYLQVVGQLLEKPMSASKAEVFMLIMRSILVALSDAEATETLREVRLH